MSRSELEGVEEIGRGGGGREGRWLGGWIGRLAVICNGGGGGVGWVRRGTHVVAAGDPCRLGIFSSLFVCCFVSRFIG